MEIIYLSYMNDNWYVGLMNEIFVKSMLISTNLLNYIVVPRTEDEVDFFGK